MNASQQKKLFTVYAMIELEGYHVYKEVCNAGVYEEWKGGRNCSDMPHVLPQIVYPTVSLGYSTLYYCQKF